MKSTTPAIYGALILGGVTLILVPLIFIMVQPRGVTPDKRPDEKLGRLLHEDIQSPGIAKPTAPVTVHKEASWRTITGVVKVADNAPPPAQISVTTNDDCGPQYDWSLVVDQETGGLKNSVIYLVSGLGKNDADSPDPVWVHPQYSMQKNPAQRDVQFDQKGCKFLDHMFVARIGQKINMTNSDPFLHNVNINPKDGSPASNQGIPGGTSNVYTPTDIERIPCPVTCSIHPWMKAYMLFRDNPYFAVTDEKGRFTIENLPAGADLEFRAWHESRRIRAVTINGENTTWKKGQFSLNLQQGDTPLDFNIVIK